MSYLSDEQLLALNRQGLIPGPNESVESFVTRSEYCSNLREHLSIELQASLAGEESDQPEILDEANHHLSELYDTAPVWIPLFFSNYRLPFWHGGCAWIFQEQEESPIGALIQLRRSLKKNPTYLGIYHRDELLIHELVHVGRMAFQEPKFEEFLAYRTSSSSFRKFFGPIVQSSMESMVFLLAIFLIIVSDLFLINLHSTEAYLMALGLKIIPIGMIIFALMRLWRRWTILNACLKNLEVCLLDSKMAWPVIYRLSDHEIFAFANMSEEEIKNYAAQEAERELRWHVISKAYFF